MTGGYQRQQATYVSTGDPETVNDSKLFAPGQVGMYTTIKQPGPAGDPGAESFRDKVYRYIRTDSSMTVSPFKGAVAWWSDKKRYLVTTSASATSRSQRAGVFQGAITKGNYGFIQTGGPATVKFVNAPAGGNPWATKGLWVIPSATDGKAETIAEGTAPTYPTLGISQGTGDAAAAEAIVELDIVDTP